jgi:hypothetical protein
MNTEYLQHFEENLLKELMRLCLNKGLMGKVLLHSDDIDARWKEIAPEYMADAVKEIAHYPTVSVAWAAYLGMGVASGWDKDWETYSKLPYQSYYGPRGFDDMDEHIMEKELGITPAMAKYAVLEDMIRTCGETTVALIRHEHVEPQSVTAFYIYARACRCMFRIGESLALAHLGYKIEAQ